MQGWFSTQKSINVIHHVHKLRKRKHIIIRIQAEKAFGRNGYSFPTSHTHQDSERMAKTRKRAVIRTYWHHTSGWRTQCFPETRQWGKALCLPMLYNSARGVFGEEWANTMQQTGKEVELPLSFTDMIIDFWENPTESRKTATRTKWT